MALGGGDEEAAARRAGLAVCGGLYNLAGGLYLTPLFSFKSVAQPSGVRKHLFIRKTRTLKLKMAQNRRVGGGGGNLPAVSAGAEICGLWRLPETCGTPVWYLA